MSLMLAVTALWAEAAMPPGEAGAKAALDKSPRHGEWVEIAVPGSRTPLRTYVVYPERADKAPMVIIIHEIFGLSDWIRSVADQLAADGFIALAPDLVYGLGPKSGGTDAFASRDDVVKAVMGLKADKVFAALDAVRAYGAKLPAANGKSATMGFCWGGGMSFAYAGHQPELNAAVVFYGTSPDAATLERIKAPVLGLYGKDGARVVATVEPAAQRMKTLSKTYIYHIYDGAGHGFLRQQDGRNGANLKASEQAWPAVVEFLKQNSN